MIKQLLEHVIKQLVDNPEAVKIEVFHDVSKIMVEIRVSPDDFKRVIGKEGRVIKSLRTLASAITPSPEQPIVVDIVT
jgi:hypothetical protein